MARRSVGALAALPTKSDRMALRLEGGLTKGLEDGGMTGVFALIGHSFFTR